MGARVASAEAVAAATSADWEGLARLASVLERAEAPVDAADLADLAAAVVAVVVGQRLAYWRSAVRR